MSLYNADGQEQVTIISGTTFTGLYAADGSKNGVIAPAVTGLIGSYHPCGAYWVTVTTNPSAGPYAPDGSRYIIGSSNGFALTGNPSDAVPANKSFFGVNLSGPEFAPWNGQTFPTLADYTTLANKGITFIRLPIAWESLQTTLGGTLDATYLASINTSLSRAASVGIKCLVDVHNYGLYTAQAQWTTTVPYAGNGGTFPATGVSALGSGITQANFTDLWTKLSTALAGNPGLLGYGLMNEPSSKIVGPQLATQTNYFTDTVPFTGSTWFTFNSPVLSQLGAGTNPLGSIYSNAWQMTQGNGFGGIGQQFTFLAATQYTFSMWVRVASGTQPFLLSLNVNDGGHTATTTWTRYSMTGTPGAVTGNIGLVANGANAPIQIANCQLEVGAAPTTYFPSTYFPFAQAAITAIRAVDTTAPIYVNGQNFGAASTWFRYNNDNIAFIGGNVIHEAHTYFDGPQGVGDGGIYSGTFTSYSIDTQTGVNTNALWLAWLSQYGQTGFLGEFAIVNSGADNNAQWFVVQQNTMNALRASNVKGCQWFYGANGVQPANNLNLTPTNDPRLAMILSK